MTISTRDPDPPDPPRRTRRLLIVAAMLATLVALALAAAWQLLPLLAPQFVIRHSPWIWPMIRAEACETEGMDHPPPGYERVSLEQRLYDEEWALLAIPRLAAALEHPDLRLRRTAAKALVYIRDGSNLIDGDLDQPRLAAQLLRLLDDEDGEVFTHAFALLQGTRDAAIAQAMLPHVPRASGLAEDGKQRVDWQDPFIAADRPHDMRFLRLAHLVDAVKPWLDADDPALQQLACLVLGFSNDPRALDLLIARLGRHVPADDRLGVDDPVAVALKESSDPRAVAAIHQALGDPLASRRAAAVRAARLRKDPASLPLLVAMEGESDPAVRLELAQALSAYPLEAVIDRLVAIIARGDAPALTALTWARLNLMRRGYALMRKRGGALASLPEFMALESLLFTRFTALLPGAEPAVRVALVEYVGLVKEHGEEGRRLLRSLADDADPQVRAAVATALKRLNE
jgi:HEAT repeat protein